MNKEIDKLAKDYANKWNADNGIKNIIIKAFKEGYYTAINLAKLM